MTLKISISGIRGIIGKSLTNGVISDFSKAFATYINKGTVVIGKDTRPSGNAIEKIVISCLRELGINVIYAGICPTPTVQILIKKLKAQGGIIITASHNPIQWNGLKFANNKGIFLDEKQNEKMIKTYNSKRFKKTNKKGKYLKLSNPHDHHLRSVLKIIDLKKIQQKKFKVVLDSCNGAGSKITEALLKKLGCKVIHINSDIKKAFARGTEPTPKNLKGLCKKVKQTNSDIGFAQDPDVDRLSIVSDKGIAIGEEYSMVLAAMQVLSMKNTRSPIMVTNLSSSMMIDSVAKKYKGKVLRSKVGEINVVSKMIRSKAVFGGEGNGGVIYPEVISSRDSLTGIVLILSLMATREQKLSKIINDIPKYHMIKTKVSCRSNTEVKNILNKVIKKYKKEKMITSDGIKVLFKDSWLHVRPSNTEPVIRIITEGKSVSEAARLAKI